MKQIFPSLNKRVISEKALYRAFQKFRVTVRFESINDFGLYIPRHVTGLQNLRKSDKSLVVINPLLQQNEQLYIGFHELVHVVTQDKCERILACSSLECDFSDKQAANDERRFEMEAHAIASICMIPETHLAKVFNEQLFYTPTKFELMFRQTRWSLRQNYYL